MDVAVAVLVVVVVKLSLCQNRFKTSQCPKQIHVRGPPYTYPLTEKANASQHVNKNYENYENMKNDLDFKAFRKVRPHAAT
jgi:hypothetical protein